MIADWLPAIALGGCLLFFALVASLQSILKAARSNRVVSNELHIAVRDDQSSQPIGRIDGWFQRVVEVSKMGLDTNSAAILIVGVGMIVGVALFVPWEDPFLGLFGAFLGSVVCFLGISIRASYVRAKVRSQLPNIVDMLASAIRAGVSVENSIATVADRTHNILGVDLKKCSQKIGLGLPTAFTLQELAELYQLLDLRLLASAVAVHQQTGGDLSTVMEQIARVSREREDFRRQMSGMTISARLAAAIVGSAAPLLLAYYHFRGNGLGRLWEDPSGKFLLLLALGLEIVGVLWILTLTRKDV